MKQEFEISSKTVEDALAKAAAQIGVDVSELEYEIIKAPKKGFLGFGEAPATIRVSYEPDAGIVGLDFVKTLIANLGIRAEATLKRGAEQNTRIIDIEGADVGILIGHHGETLDSLQYLVNLAANRREEDGKSAYTRITVDIENYRAKREQTLRSLARRMAQKVLRYGKAVTLEPMNPYERRIIHSELQEMAGVTTTSVGADNNRRVVIYLEGEEAPTSVPSRRSASDRHARRSRRSAFDIFEPEETYDAEEDSVQDDSSEYEETAEDEEY